jgi:hypothetical protein
MMMRGLIGALTVSSILVALSFFVLCAAKKADASKLTVFGYCVAAFLWVVAALVLFSGVMAPCRQGMQPPPMGQGFPGMQTPGGCERGGMGMQGRPMMGDHHLMQSPAEGAPMIDRGGEGAGSRVPMDKEKGAEKAKTAH